LKIKQSRYGKLGIVIYSLYKGDREFSKWLKSRKHRLVNHKKLDEEELQWIIIDRVALLLKGMNFNIITIPPCKHRRRPREAFIGHIAKMLSAKLDIDFVITLKDHIEQMRTLKDRLRRPLKNYFVKQEVTGKKILLLDDFVYTGITMYRAKKTLEEMGNEVYPLALTQR